MPRSVDRLAGGAHRDDFGDPAAASLGLLGRLDTVENRVAVGARQRFEERARSRGGVERGGEVGRDGGGRGRRIGSLPAAVGLGGVERGLPRRRHPPTRDQLLRAVAILFRPFALAFARGEASQEPGVVIFVDLTIDPAMAQRAVDRFCLGQRRSGIARLGELEPQAIGVARLRGEPAFPRRKVVEGDDGQAGLGLHQPGLAPEPCLDNYYASYSVCHTPCEAQSWPSTKTCSKRCASSCAAGRWCSPCSALCERSVTATRCTSEWREDARRTKRFYRLSTQGVEMLAQLLGEWNAISDSILRLTE